jgi:glyoxylase I family protein
MTYPIACGLFCVAFLILSGCAAAAAAGAAEPAATARPQPATRPVFRAAAVRYQVRDVDRAVAFYTGHLGFTLEDHPGPPFAKVANGNLVLWLSGPKSSGARPMPDGRTQQPGGWNRVVLEVDDLPAAVETLKRANLRFRNQIESGPGGKQIQIEDPDGNPIELFQPAEASR